MFRCGCLKVPKLGFEHKDGSWLHLKNKLIETTQKDKEDWLNRIDKFNLLDTDR